MWLSCVLLVTACFPEVEPHWLVNEPRVIGIRTEVVANGPYSIPLSEDPVDRVRAELLPGDQFRLEAFATGLEGVLPEDGVFYQCNGATGCSEIFGAGEIPPCGALRPNWITCRLGTANEQPFVVADFDDPGWQDPGAGRVRYQVAYLTGTNGLDHDACRQKLQEDADDLWDCVLGTAGFELGPHWTLDELLEEFADGPPASVPEVAEMQEPESLSEK